MEKNLFQQAKDFMENLNQNNDSENQSEIKAEDRTVVTEMIQSAYNDATPEEAEELRQFEEQLKRNI